MVLFALSTIPSDWGRNGVVRVFVIPSNLQNSRKTSDSKFEPWSECIERGTPKMETILSTNVFATAVASWLLSGMASNHLLKYRVISNDK